MLNNLASAPLNTYLIIFLGLISSIIAVAVFFVIFAYIIFAFTIKRPKLVKNISRGKFMMKFLKRVMGDNYDELIIFNEKCINACKKIPCREVEITSKDNLILRGYLFDAHSPSDRTVICLHGYGSDGYNDFSQFASFYRELNYNMLLVTHRGHGRSEGKYIGFATLDRYDLLKWIELIMKEYPNGKIFLHGLSMGASTAMMASGLSLPKCVKGIIADCGFTTAWEVLKFQMRTIYKLHAFPILHLTNFMSRKLAGYDFHTVSSAQNLRKSKIPTLFIHGAEDRFVPSYMVYICYANCKAKKELLVIEGAGHTGCYFTNKELYENKVKLFLQDK